MRILGHACLLRSIAVLHTLSIQSLVLKVIRFGAFLWKKKNRFPWNFSKWKNSVVYPVGYDPPLYFDSTKTKWQNVRHYKKGKQTTVYCTHLGIKDIMKRIKIFTYSFLSLWSRSGKNTPILVVNGSLAHL